MAAFKGADGKLLCEFLSSDKYRDFANYQENMRRKKDQEFTCFTDHFFLFKSPCSSSQCQNVGTCIPSFKYNSYDCLCEQSFAGEYCEKVVKSCKELYEVYRSDVSRLVALGLDSKPVSVLCHMGDIESSPTITMNNTQTTFRYYAPYWSDYKGYNLPGGETGFDGQESKVPTYWNTSFL
ncbi:unnamed protein product [Pocillopora meandrina]|uniref:EGF-like domain-containing protein n=1 Tax=Pocillopora meandrina TaxID=46732 RepID=A0AAU9X9R5_9CNID|nr:unnamed protein product [Pocillopora meandrina]